MKRPDAKKEIAAGSTSVRLTNGLLLKPNRRRQQETIAFHLHSPAAAAVATHTTADTTGVLFPPDTLVAKVIKCARARVQNCNREINNNAVSIGIGVYYRENADRLVKSMVPF